MRSRDWASHRDVRQAQEVQASHVFMYDMSQWEYLRHVSEMASYCSFIGMLCVWAWVCAILVRDRQNT